MAIDMIGQLIGRTESKENKESKDINNIAVDRRKRKDLKAFMRGPYSHRLSKWIINFVTSYIDEETKVACIGSIRASWHKFTFSYTKIK